MKISGLKKKLSERLYNFLKRNYNDDLLSTQLPLLFGNINDIRYICEDDYPKLKIIINNSFEKNNVSSSTKSAKELLNESGFILFDDIKNKSDYMIFNKYFKSNEKLCKFNSYDATNRYHKVFFILRKDIDNIVRPDKPDRYDLYSTSCMSVGISKDKQNVHQITSRYNHTVSGCDNLYNSNLNNIIDGLSLAFNKDYNLNLNLNSTIEIKDFYYVDGKYHYYSYEIDGKKFGNNCIDGIYYDLNTTFIFDNYVLNIKEKVLINSIDDTDSFIDIINEYLNTGHKISIEKDNEYYKLTIGSMILLIKNRRIISLSDNTLKVVGNNFLYCNERLTSIKLPNVTSIGYNFLCNNKILTSIELPNIASIGNDFLYRNETLTSIEVPNVKSIGNNFLYRNESLTSIKEQILKNNN